MCCCAIKPATPSTKPEPLNPLRLMVPLKQIEFGFGYILIRSPYTPYSIYLRGTIIPIPQSPHPASASKCDLLLGQAQERSDLSLSVAGSAWLTQSPQGLGFRFGAGFGGWHLVFGYFPQFCACCFRRSCFNWVDIAQSAWRKVE